MICAKVSFTVLFEEPFWIGIYEAQDKDGYAVCKVTFGVEPKEAEVYEFVLKRWNDLRISVSKTEKGRDKKCSNPKRMQRAVSKCLSEKHVGTKAQEALKKQHEEGKVARKKFSHEKDELEKERKFALKHEKRREKHRGH